MISNERIQELIQAFFEDHDHGREAMQNATVAENICFIDYLEEHCIPKAKEINNKDDVARAIQNKTQMDGVDLQSLAAYTNESTNKDQINITITVTAYKTTTTGTNVTNGSIVIKPNETYSITALAIGKTEDGGITVDIKSIIITTIRKLYSNTGNGTWIRYKMC